ncbi:ATP-binding protein [Caenimonas sp. SL110]|uniref:ATP-binding protein n=1 Tax=Caenimonas sp. SL110 TaxID=1450524 RepID=UPI000653EAA6|nr:ATP-binding protein [Caenimonas sp. SL110]
MDLEIPDSLASALRGLLDPQSQVALQLDVQGAGRGVRVVSSHHFDGSILTTLYQMGCAAGAKDLVHQLLALDNLNGESQLDTIASLELMVPAIVRWLGRDVIDGWLYQRGKDGVLLAWLVHSVRLVRPADGQGSAYVMVGLIANTLHAAGRPPPSDPRMRFAGMTWGISFYAEDLPGRTVADLFADHGFYKECHEFRQEYQSHVDRFMQLQAKFGEQFTITGGLWRAVEGSPRAGLEFLRLQPGITARCVNDEALLERRFDMAADAHFWRESGIATGFDRIPQHAYLHLFHLDWHRNVWVHSQFVEPYEYSPSVRDRLVLPQAHRDLVDILTADRNFLMEDVVPGKSGGTTILCQGAPGLGKTLTAEVYAEVVGKPLYRVHSGQLGVTASSVEANLTAILQRAARWDCVLLLDEADVYIRKRDNDLQHNAIVAEFLRNLEYFSGLLFMTTNRVSDIDDAILSRCIAVITYEPPGPEDARRLWSSLAGQFGIEMPGSLIDEVVAAFPGISGRDIKELLKLTSKFCRQKQVPLSREAFAQCAVFRDLACNRGSLQ